jgi:hypothetical protein
VTISYADLPRPIRSGLVLVDPRLGIPRRVIVMQFNPDTLSRTLTPQTTTGESGDRSEALRLTAPAIETWQFDAQIDATDQFDRPTPNGILPQLAVLELLIHPPVTRLLANQRLADLGTIEITPIDSPLALWVWGDKRVLPVRVTQLTVNETYFDLKLDPVRATVTIEFRVLSSMDLPTHSLGGDIFLAHLAQQELLALGAGPTRLAWLGITDL